MPKEKKPVLVILLLILLLAGFASSLYLTDLYFRAHDPQSGEIDSFCNVSEGVNCVTVAASKYSAVLGIPVSVYGLEFYLVALCVVLMGNIGIMRLESWQSLLFYMALLSLPICILLFIVAEFLIGSLCLLCCVVYTVNFLTFVILLVVNRRALSALISDGPKELVSILQNGGAGRIVLALAAILALSQFFWLPVVMGTNQENHVSSSPWQGLATDGRKIGNPNATIVIEEFTDFECPWCSRAAQVVLELVKKYPDDILLIHRDMPMDQSCNPELPRPFHKHACTAAVYARCAETQGAFWPYAEVLFQNQNALEKEKLVEYADQQNLNLPALKRCVQDKSVVSEIQEDIAEGRKRDIRGTPTFFINGEKLTGYKSLEYWETKVGGYLMGQSADPGN